MKTAVLLLLAGTAFGSTQTLVDTQMLWKDPRVEVCFGSADTRLNPKSPLVSDLRRAGEIRNHSPFENRIRSLLEREFNPERTGMRYGGFGNCDRVPSDEPDAPVFIFADTDLSDFGVTSVGDESRDLDPADRRGLISGSVLNLQSVRENREYSVGRAANGLMKVAGPGPTRDRLLNLTADIDERLKEDLIDVTVLHEMGHLAGLHHEERRRDSTRAQPKWCRNGDDRRAQEPHEKTFGTEFDPFSIMNYCTDDIAKGFAYFHLFCEFPRLSAELAARDPTFDWSRFAPFCGFMLARDYAARLSLRDRAGLRRAYLDVPVPPGSRSYRTNPDEVHVLDALDALYEALPETMYYGEAGRVSPGRRASRRN